MFKFKAFKCQSKRLRLQSYGFQPSGYDYLGGISETATGLKCLDWKSHYPSYNEHWDKDYLRDHNFCRNPDYSSYGVWCYAKNSNGEVFEAYCAQIQGFSWFRCIVFNFFQIVTVSQEAKLFKEKNTKEDIIEQTAERNVKNGTVNLLINTI